MAGIHDGPRARLRNKLKKYGFDCLEDHEKLEYLLFSFIPRRDTNPIAHELIATFGSFRKVLDADVEALASVKGMSENAALFLHLLPQTFSAYLLSEKEQRFTSPERCAELVIAHIGMKKEEHFLTIYLDEECRVIRIDLSSSHKNRTVEIDREKLVSDAVRYRAKYVVIGHNHPNGNVSPSPADVESTNRIVQALGMVGIKLADHVIVSGSEYYSMRKSGDLVEAVDLKGSLNQFAQSLIRRENDVDRILHPKGEDLP